MNSQIRYLAIVSERPETLAHFYANYFSMRELGRSDEGDIALTDGFYNISILKRRDSDEELGINHFGITIEDIGQVEARLRDFAPRADIRQEQGGLFHGDYRVWPDRNPLHASVPHAKRRAYLSMHSPPRRVRSEQR